ncbi:hypothetical protein CSB45_15535 [candidate division KSB3 bacterium]|uniref:RecC C-terminal domain-containing protein n=1 Tax=candidate division KSB3 bacterium TaxID=2044937 RepID=A0A2G6E0E6_9BACT|nr:MAG: hypothetical protein CSB45_15535 [candidate division KSB3 bacterium]
MFSYDAMYSQVAAGFTKPRHEHGPWWQGRLAKEHAAVSWQDLRKFYRHPQRWFVADCLGVCLRDEIIRAEVSETFCQDGLEKYLVNAALITQLAQGEKKEIVLQRLQAEGRWPLGASGALMFQDRVVEVEPFLEQINDLQPGAPLPAQTFSLEVAGIELHGMIENIYQDGVFLWGYRKLQARDILDAWLHHLVWQRQGNRQQETVLLGSDGVVHIPGDLPGTPDLKQLVTLFLEGCKAPSLLYPEAGFAGFASQEKDKKFRAGMVKFFRKRLSRGYDPELAFLLGERDPETLVTKEVEELCETVLAPLWRLRS